MQFQEALNIIKKHYETDEFTDDISIIKTYKLIDIANFYFITVVDEDGIAKISDMAKTCEFFEKSEEEWLDICTKFGLVFDNYTIKTNFNGMEDLDNFVAMLDYLVESN